MGSIGIRDTEAGLGTGAEKSVLECVFGPDASAVIVVSHDGMELGVHIEFCFNMLSCLDISIE